MTSRFAAALSFAVSSACSLLASPLMPDRVPVHWGIDGTPDRYGSKYELLLLGPGLSLLVGGLLALLEPRDARIREEDDPGPRQAITSLALGLVTMIHVVILAHVLGLLSSFPTALSLGISAFMVLCGNLMTRLRPNTVAGIRTPWTLGDDEVWRLTHRFGGKLWFVAGLVNVPLALSLPVPGVFAAMLVSLLGTSVAMIYYSWHVYRRLHPS